MKKVPEPCYYPEYLKLDQLLGSQVPVSGRYGKEAHDETLFIIVHQVYELWFKQIRHELYSVLDIFKKPVIEESEISTCLSRFYRINSICKVLIDQLNVIETMTPESFLDFRDYLVPASGFQSWQFREIEIRLGLKVDHRVKFDKQSFMTRLKPEEQKYLKQVEAEKSFYDYLGEWLERLPFVEFGEYSFWEEYEKSVDQMLKSDVDLIKANPSLTDVEIENQLKELENTRFTFKCLLDADKYKDHLSKHHRLSQKATLAALFIRLYSRYPLLSMPSRFLTSLIDLDEHITTWRYRHSIMAQRMLGRKIGTGGSSGHNYLRATTVQNRIFTDLFNLSTYLLPTSALPQLPDYVEKKLSFSL